MITDLLGKIFNKFLGGHGQNGEIEVKPGSGSFTIRAFGDAAKQLHVEWGDANPDVYLSCYATEDYFQVVNPTPTDRNYRIVYNIVSGRRVIRWLFY